MQMSTNRQMVTTFSNINNDTNIKFLGRNDIMKCFILKKNLYQIIIVFYMEKM